MTLLEKTLRLAAEADVPMDEIARHLGVSTRWYQKVLAGQIAEPSVVKIQALHDFLLLKRKLKRGAAA